MSSLVYYLSSYLMKYIKFIIAPFIILSICSSSINAADLAREKRMADEIGGEILAALEVSQYGRINET